MSELAEHATDLAIAVAGPGAVLTQLPGGANNRVYRVDGPLARAVVKAYFRHPSDPRDRLAAEYAFCEFCQAAGVRLAPAPLGREEHAGLAAYEFIEGRAASTDDVDVGAVERAAGFVAALNAARELADRLPTASESCFSVDQHLATVERRVDRLGAIATDDGTGQAAKRFVADRLRPAWERIAAAARTAVTRAGMTLDAELPRAQRCVSPSDFGFHNAIISPEGIRFIDFEYAGWDDPAKLICDFFSQVAVPVPQSYFESFAAAALADLSSADAAIARARALLPVYRVKWTCILLNEFTATASARRAFASGGGEDAGRRGRQLEKAAAMLSSAETST